MRKKTILLLVSIGILSASLQLAAQTVPRNIKTNEYLKLQERICSGWNTWYNNSLLTHALLPEGFSLNLCMARTGWSNAYIREVFKQAKIQGRPEEVTPGLRSDDGSYTSLDLSYSDQIIRIQSASVDQELYILVTPLTENPDNIMYIEAGILWDKEGSVGMQDAALFGKFRNRVIKVRITEPLVESAYMHSNAPRINFSLSEETGIYTGKRLLNLEQIRNIIALKRQEQERRVDSYGENAATLQAMQTILGWNTIYDAPNKRAITPVSRFWNNTWGGFVLFEWDTYFASYMLSFFNKDLAYANAVEMTKAITPDGFVPNYSAAFKNYSRGNSQPPIGSRIILEIYKKYKEKWFLEETYDELLSWNRWWAENRSNSGVLSWGCNTEKIPGSNYLQMAKYESGLDNSPMYDNVAFNEIINTMELADIGLTSLYIMDCNSLAEIAGFLGKGTEQKELEARAQNYRENLSKLWDEEAGIYLNLNTATGEKSTRVSPTNLYPMLARACTQEQAEVMIERYYFNPHKFQGEFVIPSITRDDPAFEDNDYWRGRIWAPMNFLVYLGMKEYDLPEARKDLVDRSRALLMKSWEKDGSIYENYNASTGQGNDVGNADAFYHWGALLGFMSLLEDSKSPE